MLRSLYSIAFLLAFLLSPFFSSANAVPLVLSHQGRLLDASDHPLSGTFTIIYSIHDAPVGGNQLWLEDHVGVVVTDGLFSVQLGTTVALSADVLAGSGGGGGGGGVARYLQVQISGQPPIMPRTQLVSSPYSVATSRVAGDIQTAPGALHMFAADSSATVDIGTASGSGKKVAKFKAGAELAGSVNKREVAITASDDSARIAIDEAGVHRMMISSTGGASGLGGSVMLALSNLCCLDDDSDDDGVPDQCAALVSNESSNSVRVVRLNGLPPGTPVIGTAALSAYDDSASVTLGNLGAVGAVSCVSSVSSLGGGGGGASSAAYAATGRMTQSGLDQVKTRVDADGPSLAMDKSGDQVVVIQADNDTTKMELTNRTKHAAVLLSSSDVSRVLQVIDMNGDEVAETSVSSSCDATGASQVMEKKGLNAVNVKLARAISSSPGSLAAIDALDMDSDDDGLMDRRISSVCDATSSRLAIKTNGTGADANKSASLTVSASPGGSVRAVCAADVDGDDVPESEISQSVTPTTCGVAINTKGTGADKGRTIGSTCDDSSAIQHLDIDEDGDGHAEARGIISVKAATGSGSMSASSRMTCDSDDDGIPESEYSQVVTPTTCGVAINTKGTGADKGRTISSSCDSAGAGQEIMIDDDGDGHAEARGIVVVKSPSGTGAGSASSRMTYDSDDDGEPESEISQVVTPTTCGVAINTKGTGADKGRTISSSCDSAGAGQEMIIDDDGDGHAEARGIISVKSASGTGSASANSQMTCDSDDDGVTDVSVVTVVNADSASLRLNGLPPGVPVTGTISMTASPTGAHMAVGAAYCDGTNWVNASDKNSKENFQDVDGEELLDKIADLNITRWNYKNDKETEHIGPTAQDFQETFGVGSDGKSISTIDPSGIALAAIKELYAQLKAKDKEMGELRSELAKLKQEIAKKK